MIAASAASSTSSGCMTAWALRRLSSNASTTNAIPRNTSSTANPVRRDADVGTSTTTKAVAASAQKGDPGDELEAPGEGGRKQWGAGRSDEHRGLVIAVVLGGSSTLHVDVGHVDEPWSRARHRCVTAEEPVRGIRLVASSGAARRPPRRRGAGHQGARALRNPAPGTTRPPLAPRAGVLCTGVPASPRSSRWARPATATGPRSTTNEGRSPSPSSTRAPTPSPAASSRPGCTRATRSGCYAATTAISSRSPALSPSSGRTRST